MGRNLFRFENGLPKEQVLKLQELLEKKASLIKVISVEAPTETGYHEYGFREPNFLLQRILTIEWEEKHKD